MSENAGFDPTDIVNELRARHAKGCVLCSLSTDTGTLLVAMRRAAAGAKGRPEPGTNKWIGVDIENEGVIDTFKSFVWEPALLKVLVLCLAWRVFGSECR